MTPATWADDTKRSPEFRDVEYAEDEDGAEFAEIWDEADELGISNEDEGYLSDEDWEDALSRHPDGYTAIAGV